MPVAGFTSISYADYNGEIGNVRVNAAELDEANWLAQETARIALMDAIAAITLGLRAKHVYGNDSRDSLAKAADDAAQREKKWLVQYHDPTTLKRYTTEIPCADTSFLDPEDRGNAEIGDAGPVDAFISAFEAFVLTPDGGSAVVDEITFVGRNV